MTHSLNKFLDQHHENPSISELVNILPPGWINVFYNQLISLCNKFNVSITELDIRDGVLYISTSWIKSDPTMNPLIEYITRSMSQESSRRCMVCGLNGRRRKEQLHKPPLCQKHYIDYINDWES